jgi:hypothetical protein
MLRPMPLGTPASYSAQLRTMPLLRALSAAEFAQALATQVWVALRPGDARTEQGVLFYLVEGEVLIYEDDRLAGTARAPAVLGAYPPGFQKAGLPRIRLEALTEAGVFLQSTSLIHGASPSSALAQDRQLLLEEHLQETLGDLRRVELALEDFLSPTDGTMVPGPYRCEASVMHLVVLEGLPVELPRGLARSPGSGDRSLLVLSHFEDFHPVRGSARTTYDEAALMVPVLDSLVGPGLYAPAFYPDSGMAVLAGRELFGYPKRLARVELSEDEALVALDERLNAWVRWDRRVDLHEDAWVRELSRALLQLPLERISTALAGEIADLIGLNLLVRGLPSVPIYTRRQVGELSPASGQGGVDELVSSPFIVRRIRSLQRLAGLATVLREQLAGARVLGGWAVTSALELDAGLAIRDLREGLRPRLRSAWLRARVALPGFP